MTPWARIAAVAAMAMASLGTMACTQGQGEGIVGSDQLWAKDCWCSGYNMQPDFFAAVPYRDTLQIRVQRGADVQEISDGISILIDDVPAIRPDSSGGDGLLGQKLAVTLPAELEPLATGKAWSLGGETGEGCKAEPLLAQLPTDDDASKNKKEKFQSLLGQLPTATPAETYAPLVHMALYLQQSCHNQNIVLYAVSGWILFTSLFSGDPNEAAADAKLTEAVFDVMVGDPQDAPMGQSPEQIPIERQTNLKGYFNFYFQRGQPAQPFP
jgi:hypothetical protein